MMGVETGTVSEFGGPHESLLPHWLYLMVHLSSLRLSLVRDIVKLHLEK